MNLLLAKSKQGAFFDELSGHLSDSREIQNRDESIDFESPFILNLLMKMRVIALVCQCIVVFPAMSLGWLGLDQIVPYAAVIFGLTFVTLFTVGAVKLRVVTPSRSFLFLQLSIDTVALSLLLKFSGGPWNPFVALMLFHGALGALILRGPLLTFYFLLISWCLVLVHWDPALPPALAVQPTPSAILFPVQCLILLLFGGLIMWSNQKLEESRRSLRRLREEKQQVDRLRAFGVIATGFSHEFATPLATLKLKLARLKERQTLEADPDLSLALEAAEQAELSLKRMMSPRVLSEGGEFVELEVVSVLENFVRMIADGHSKIGLSLPQSKLYLRAPQVSFHQMLLDLIDNALRANRQSGNGQIEIQVKLESRFVLIMIRDHGPGFPKWILDNVGTPFFSTRNDGSGLGLYHATVLCQALQGQLILENLDDQGAMVMIKLPVQKIENDVASGS